MDIVVPAEELRGTSIPAYCHKESRGKKVGRLRTFRRQCIAGTKVILLFDLLLLIRA